jgi:hypothetical protein
MYAQVRNLIPRYEIRYVPRNENITRVWCSVPWYKIW